MNRACWSVPAPHPILIATAMVLVSSFASSAHAAVPPSWEYRTFDGQVDLRQPTPGLDALVLDDGSAEGALGISGTVPGTARQFLWFNSFTVPSLPFDVSEVWVLFPPDPTVPLGGAIQLALWLDSDSDPSDGAQLLAGFDEVVQAADGTTFSVYTLDPPLRLSLPGRLLVGVVNRFVTTDVTPNGVVAALDTSSSAGRSWIAVYSGDPPNPPSLPADQLLSLVDVFQPGNWMIRAYGEQVLNPGIPELEGWRVGLLVVLIAGAGVAFVGRRGR